MIGPTLRLSTNTFCDHVVAACERQAILRDWIDERGCRIDIQGGTLTLGGKGTFRLQLLALARRADDRLTLGSIEEIFSAWPSLRAVRPPFGLEVDPVLCSRRTPQRAISDHLEDAALLASGITGALAYLRAQHPAGSLYLLVKPSENEAILKDRVRIPTVFAAVLLDYELDQPRALAAYLRYHGFDLEWTDRELTGRHADGERATATFDSAGALVSLTGTLGIGTLARSDTRDG